MDTPTNDRNPMEGRALLTVMLIALLWGFYIWLNRPMPGAETPTGPTSSQEALDVKALASPPAHEVGSAVAKTESPQAPETPPQENVLTSSHLELRLTSDGARPVSARLPNYRMSLREGSKTIDLLRTGADPATLPLSPGFLREDGSQGIPPNTRFEVIEAEPTRIKYQALVGDAVITRAYELTEKAHQVRFSETISNSGAQPINGRAVAQWSVRLKTNAEVADSPDVRHASDIASSSYGSDQFNQIALVRGRIDRRTLDEGDPREDVGGGKPVRWFGADDRYFTTLIVPVDPPLETETAAKLTYERTRDNVFVARVERAPLALAPGGTQTYTYEMYIGPKSYIGLRAFGYDVDKVLNMGRFLTPIAIALLRALQWFHGALPNWGVAIMFLTLIVKVALLPLTHKSMKSMRESQQKMAGIQPHMNRLKERYPSAEDRDKLNKEMMALYQQHGINPLATLGGCFPMLLQMPIWFAFYRVLMVCIELRQAPLGGWIRDLSVADPYYVLPVILGATMLAQQKLMPQATGMDPMQQKIMNYGMPIMFTFIMWSLPSGLVLYIFVNSILSILQTMYINRIVGPGHVAPMPM